MLMTWKGSEQARRTLLRTCSIGRYRMSMHYWTLELDTKGKLGNQAVINFMQDFVLYDEGSR